LTDDFVCIDRIHYFRLMYVAKNDVRIVMLYCLLFSQWQHKKTDKVVYIKT